jgi:hypothetical protein
MGIDRVPTTLVICCPVTPRTTADQLDAWVRRTRQAVVPVTWVTPIESLASTLDVLGGADRSGGVALEMDPSWLSSRQSLRRMLGRARATIPSLDTVVLRGPVPLEHRAVLVEEGIRTVAVDGFSDVARVSRRPAPHGWPCRSVVWGLWEVRSGSPSPSTMIAKLFSWGSFQRPVPGGLAVLHAGEGLPGDSSQATLGRLERLLSWVDRQRRSGTLHLAGLADVPALLAGAGHLTLRGSVLKAA